MSEPLPQGALARWRYALKPGSWSKLFGPAFFGQCLGAAHLRRIDLVSLGAGMALTFFLLAFVVLMNDFADREVDAIKRRMFPRGCSPKTIPDGILPASRVLVGGLLAGGAALGLGFYAEGWLNRPQAGLATALALGVFVAYSLPPLRLNYRGGGELLEGFGAGFALPWLQAYLQGGLGAFGLAWLPRAWPVLGGLVLLALASAVASGLSDEVSDRAGGKRTFTTVLGNAGARRLCELLVALGAGAWLLAGFFAEHVPLVVTLAPVLLVLFRLRQLWAASTDAVTNAFAAHAHYKNILHRAIGGGAELLGVSIFLERAFFS
jgi:4-hydroxybenzoate polyprenyltransferase